MTGLSSARVAKGVETASDHKDGRVFVYNKTRETFVATEVKVADGYFSRLVGLLGKTRRWARPGQGLWIVPSHGVHTIGMLFPLDVVFLDDRKVVVHVEEHLRPFHISTLSLRASSVLELPPHTIFRTGTQAGDQLEIGSMIKQAPSAVPEHSTGVMKSEAAKQIGESAVD